MSNKEEKKGILSKIMDKIKSKIPGDVINYSKGRDKGKIAKDIVRARKNKQTGNYRKYIKEGYESLGKTMPKRKDPRTPNKPKDGEYGGKGWGGSEKKELLKKIVKK